jgi:AmiR/NasT family two-component response regulator
LFAVPFQWETINLGVLDLYRTAPGSLSDAQLRDVMRAADMAALMFLGLRTDPGEGAWLDHSLHGRAEIHQATGMVVVQLGINATDALARLRAYAFVEQRLLSDVAHDVVSRRLSFTPDTM